LAQQQFLVDQMKAIPHTDFSDEDAMRVLAIIAFYAAHQTANSEVNKPARSPEVAAAVPARQQFYVQQDCNVYHTIAGERTYWGSRA
jgi:hypothetical protein